VLQEALDPSSESGRNPAGGMNVFLIRPSDLGEALAETGQAIAALAARSAATQLVILCPDQSPAADLTPLTAPLSGLANVDLVTTEQLSPLYPVGEIFDPESDASGHIPYTETIFVAAATRIVRTLSLRSRPPVKVLALDADNTLWGGVCGEDGATGIRLDGPYRVLREFALAKRRQGLLLVLVSKNQEADVDRVFAERADDLLLTQADFSGSKVNWNPKSRNLRELAAELNLGLDSFVLLDDNPAEIGEVTANAPGVLALTLPENADEFPAFLEHLWPLDTLPATAEDAARAEFYRRESERRDLRAAAPSFADFLRGLDLRIDIAETTSDDLPRVAQLTKRTNQFNANPLRLSGGELSDKIAAGATCLSVRVSDRFGDYGLVGALLQGPVSDAPLSVELFLLSCRAMGKGVERVMLKTLAERALAAGVKTLSIAFTETDRNEPVRRFFEGLGGFTLDAATMAQLSPVPEETEPSRGTGILPVNDRRDGGPMCLFDATLAQRIATEWRDPKTLHTLLTATKHPRPEIAQAFVKPGTKTQTRLAEIWRGILGLEDVGLDDPFSSLGGSSIQLVRLHAALRREFGTALELVELFELPTIAAQAAKLEAEHTASTVSITSTEHPRHSDDDAVAVIGVALRVPGANDPDTFWRNLVDGVESISFFRQDEIEYPGEFGKPGYVPAKGLVDDIDKFDANFFGILPKDAKIMDPQQRVFLELAWEAMERSGYTPETHPQRIGIYAGAYFDTYLLTNLCTDREFLANLIPQIQVGSLQCELGNDKDYLATRVAFKMNLRGPAMTLQTACSTSMVAIIEACRAIRSGLCDMALAGGITLTLPLKRGYFYTEEGMLSRDGHCRAYDEKASGTVFGNGAGVVMLKRLSDAVRDRDHIHAVIRGTGMNNDGGVKHSYTAPSVEGQVDVIRMAHRDAGVEASSIGYIEGHGTGTPLGDPIEVKALTKAFRAAGVSENQFCALGSLKTNIGHLDVASGVCGLIKTALSLEKATLPPILHYQTPNPKIDFANSPFYVNAKLTPWTEGRHGQPRRAGISAFGVGGTNAHVILEEAPAVISTPSPRANQIFLLSARTEEALAAAATNLANFAANPGDTKAADAAWTLAIGRKPFRCRRAVAAPDFASLAEALRSGAGVRGVAERSNPPVHFLFPGQGSQHVNMGRAFYESETRFRETIDRCSELLRPHLGLSLIEVLYPADGSDLEAAAEQLKHTVLAQPAIFVIEYALADLWRHWGLEPAAMIGHSVGEFVAACHAGVFSLEGGLRLLAARGRLMGELPGGGMLSVRLSESDLLARLPDTLDLAAVNGPSLCVVAGPREELETFRTGLEAGGVVAQALHTSHAFHSRMMDPVIETFAAEFADIELRGPDIPILSTVTGEWLTAKETTDPLYWAKHLREPVRFHRSVVTLGSGKPEQLFLEVGPGSTLAGLVRQSLDRKAGHLALSTCRHVKETGCDHANAVESLGKLWAAGVEVDWSSFYSAETRKRVPLPTYPFERKRHWVDPKPLTDTQATFTAPVETGAPAIAFTETVMSTPEPACRRAPIADAIRVVLTDLSGIPAEELIGDASYLELGFDSLLLTQVSKALANQFGINLTLRDLMGNLADIDSLVAHLDATLPSDQYRPAAPAAPVVAMISAPTAPVNSAPVAVAAPAPMMIQAPAPVVAYAPMAPVNASVLEGLVAQQLDLMRQQISLLQGGVILPQTPTPTPSPSLPPAPAPTQPAAVTPAPAPAPAKPVEAPATSSNVSAPTTSINRSLDDTLTERQQRHLDELISKYVAKTRTSKELTAKYRQWHADPRTVSGFNRRWKEMIYQIAVKKSKGSRLVDVDGNEYIDLLNGFGPNFLGHSPDFVTEALKAQLDRGVEVGPQCVNAMEAAQLFCEITGNERASFVNTGSEAVQAAMRLARTVTGRDKIVIFTKDYHGNFDEVLVKGVGSGDAIRSLPIAPGIPRRAVDDMIVLPYGTDEALEIIRARAHEVAAVIVEPIQSRRPEFQPREFIREVREITRQSGSVFVFDEVITGFRTGPRGAQEFYGIEADLATYGKVVGGGMPLGVVAGKAEYMDTFDGGMWQYGDDSFPGKGVTFFAGTFVRHPLAMAAVKEVLLHLKGKGPEFWQGVKDRATRLATTVDKMFVENNAPFRMPNFGSQMFIRAAEDHKYANLLFFHLRNKGVFLLEGFPTYMTAAHSDEDIDYCITAFRESIAELQEGGFFDVPSGITVPHLNGGRLSGPPRILTAGEPAEAKKKSPDSGTPSPGIPALHPLTEPLAEVWLASQVSESSSLAFNEINVVECEGRVDHGALQSALADLVERHDALRAVYAPDGSGFTIQPSPVFNLTLSNEDPGVVLERERSTPFGLAGGPLFRATLVRREGAGDTLVLNAHHLALDGWSYTVFLSELVEAYAARLDGRAPAFPPALRFADHVDEAARRESGPESARAEQYWLDRLEEPVNTLNLPASFAIPAEPDFRSGTVALNLPPAELRELKRAAGKSGATLFGLLLAAYKILLHRLGGQTRFVLGFPAAGQNEPGRETLVGHCVHFLPFVADVNLALDGRSFIKATQGHLLDAMDHRDGTYGRLLKRLPSDRRPRIEAIFNYERMDDRISFGNTAARVREAERGYATHPLFLKTCEGESGLELRFDYHSSIFSPDTVAEWLETYRAILAAMAANPGASLSELAASLSVSQIERLRSWNETATGYPRDRCVPDLFEETASRRDRATAIRFEGGETSYASLRESCDRIAHALDAAGLAPGDRVGLFLERSPEMVAAMLAVLKCGAAYVPLDPLFPVERIHAMIGDSGAKIVVSDDEWFDRLPRNVRAASLRESAKRGRAVPFTSRAVDPDAPAVVLYTSGSTGVPKGSLISHRNIVRLVRETNFAEFGEDEVFLQAATICFDPCLYDTYGAVLNGGTLVLPSPGALTLESIARHFREDGVTQLFLTTGLFQVMVDERLEDFAGLRAVLTGGDVASPAHMARFLAAHPRTKLVHCYGPTEATTFTTSHLVAPADVAGSTVPIGRPVSNSTVWILGPDHKPVPPGAVGELYTGGDGIALGYLNRPELTAERFLPDPFSTKPGARLYRTGDLCKLRPDGLVEFVSRIDHQVKIRGFRIEPGEIEILLGRHPSVRQAKVVVRGSGACDKYLVAYVTPVAARKPSDEELAGYLRAKLPSYMVPSAFVVLDELPLNANGKVDTKALPEPSPLETKREDELSAATDGAAPSATEATLLDLWSEVLGAASIRLDDDFFSLGGHSLLGMRLFARIQKSLGVALPLAVLFKAPTVRRLASVIDERLHAEETAPMPDESGDSATPAIAVPRKGGLHLTPVAPANPADLAETTVAIQPKGDLPPLFAVHGGDGGVLFYGNLATRLGEDRPFYAFEAPALTATSPIPNESVVETASRYLVELRKVQPSGPYHLCGYSFGGVVAYEMACQLLTDGERVEFLGLVDTENPAIEARKLSLGERLAVNWKKPNLAEKGVLEKVGKIGMRIGTGLAYRLYFEAEGAMAKALPEAKGAGWLRQVQVRIAHERAMADYSPGVFEGKMTLFRAMVGGDKFELGADYGWVNLVDELDIIDVPGNHISIFHEENIEAVAVAFRNLLPGRLPANT
jgi:amino acid adenylation domain-containing protein/FkbH-like protein